MLCDKTPRSSGMFLQGSGVAVRVAQDWRAAWVALPVDRTLTDAPRTFARPSKSGILGLC